MIHCQDLIQKLFVLQYAKGEKAYSRTPGVQGVHMGVREYGGSMGVQEVKWEYIQSTTNYFNYL
jgi:hypothetical protein